MAFALAAALSMLGCSAQKDIYSSSIASLPEDAMQESGPGYARYRDPDVMVEAAYLSPAAVDLYFSRFKSGKYENPFTPRSFMVFSLSVMNRGGRKVTFNPRMTLFITEKKEPITPKDFTTLYSDFSMARAVDVDGRMKAFKASAYDTAETLMPGRVVQRLMVFPRTDETAGGGVFMFNGLYVGDKSRNVVIRYDADLGLP